MGAMRKRRVGSCFLAACNTSEASVLLRLEKLLQFHQVAIRVSQEGIVDAEAGVGLRRLHDARTTARDGALRAGVH